MTLDESKDGDDELKMDGFRVVAEKSLLGEMGGIHIDYRQSTYGGAGFVINPGKPASKSCGSCSC